MASQSSGVPTAKKIGCQAGPGRAGPRDMPDSGAKRALVQQIDQNPGDDQPASRVLAMKCTLMLAS
jgi:hypothetical protein